MIPREIEKAIQFLLEQQAQTLVQIGELVEQNKTLSGKIDKLTDGLQALGDACRNLVERARLTNARLSRLEQSET